VDTDLDTLATALFVKTDDLLKSSQQLAPWRPTAGITPQLSDAELVTRAMMQAILGFTSEARWLRHARAHLRHLFPYLPKQPGYNKRLRKAAELVRQASHTLLSRASRRCARANGCPRPLSSRPPTGRRRRLASARPTSGPRSRFR
jgi:hypothetical protein